MLEIFTIAIVICITIFGSVLSVFGLRETSAMIVNCLKSTLMTSFLTCRIIYENLADGEILTMLFLLFTL